MHIGTRRSACWALLAGAVLCAAVASLPVYGEQPQALASLPTGGEAADFWQAALHGDRARTRFIIGLERSVDPVEFQVSALTEPNRVVVDLPYVKLQLPPPPGQAPVGLIKSFRSGLSSPGRARVVIDVTGPVIVEKQLVERTKGKMARLVLEIVPAQAAEQPVNPRPNPFETSAYQLGAMGLQPPMPRPAVSPHVQAERSAKQVIVIDPGHGGDDTGAEKNGTVEKNVVLAFSLKLRDKLAAAGRYRVLMTREKDEFIELHARREFAERNRAALFVAVHADYAGSRARGATIYSLRESVAHALERSAEGQAVDGVLSEKERAAVRSVDGDVSAVRAFLADLARQEIITNRGNTNVFVKSVISYMGESTNLKDDPDREAAFVVIKSAKMPAILIELGYVTNEEDAELLRSDKWQDKVSSSIVTAIDNYFSHHLGRTFGSQ